MLPLPRLNHICCINQKKLRKEEKDLQQRHRHWLPQWFQSGPGNTLEASRDISSEVDLRSPSRLLVRTRSGRRISIAVKQGAIIGKGSFGEILKAMVKAHGKKVETLAMKKDEELGIIEIFLLTRLRHPNVIDLKYYFDINGLPCMLLEYIEDGSLHHVIHEYYNKKIKNGMGIYTELFAYQMFRGLAYAHSCGIVHRDIKPDNLLVSMRTGELKIADFNCGMDMSEEREHSTYVGTRDHRAPELLMRAQMYNEKIDVWSGAVVMTEIILRKSVFKGEHNSKDAYEALMKIFDFLGSPTEDDFRSMKVQTTSWPVVKKCKGFHDALLPGAPGVTNMDALFDLIPHIFTYKVNKRFGAWQICAHDFFSCLKNKQRLLPNGNALPALFNFSTSEKESMDSDSRNKLLLNMP